MAIANITNNILTDSGVATSALQIALNGTGFVKASGTTITYDNSTYLTTSAASSTYLSLAGGTLTGALNGTSAMFSSTMVATQGFFDGVATNGLPTSKGTAQNFVEFRNTGGDFYIGQEGSVAGNFFTGSSAYASVFYGGTAQEFIIGGVRRLQIASTGAAIFSSTLGIGGVADSVKGGTYTPTVTVISGGAYNITTYVARYTRVGNVVTVSGAFFYQPLGSGAVETNNEFTITLPITRTVTTNFASGTVSFSTVTGIGNQSQGYLYSTSTTVINLYSQNWYSGSGANAYYTFSYEIN